MKFSKKFYLVLISTIILLIFSANIASARFINEKSKQNGNQIELNKEELDKSPADDWTILVYLDADNDLEPAGIDDFLEMSSIGSDANIHIVVQFDRISGYDTTYLDWTSTKRFYITTGMTPATGNELSDLGEVNMGDPTALSDFITWGTTTYSADHYALILWNHGAGWKTAESEDNDVLKAVCYDVTDGDDLTLVEVETALTTAGVHIDVLGFDACLMGMAEVYYELKDLADVCVASQESIPNDGFPYDTILSDLKSNPTMSPGSFGQLIVNKYIESYSTSVWKGETLSAIDLTKQGDLSSAIDTLAQLLDTNMATYIAEVNEARLKSGKSGDFIDLYDFAYEINRLISDHASIENAAQSVLDNINSSVIEEAHNINHPDFHGISIYFPAYSGDYDTDYETMLAFTDDLSWYKFLNTYYSTSYPDDAYEPNDLRTSAFNISDDENTWLSSIDGLGVQLDDDWYEIYVSPGEERLYVALLFDHAAGDIDIEVQNSSGDYEISSESLDDNEFIDYTLSSSGTYYLQVHFGNAGNPYDLWWDDLDPGAIGDDAYEPNDDYSSAYDLSTYEDTWLSEIAGLGIQSDDDWYKIYVSPGYERLMISLIFEHDEGDIDLDVFDSVGGDIAWSYSSTDNEYIDVVVPSSGTYYICVNWDDAGNPYNLWWDDVSLGGEGDDPYEENDFKRYAFDLTTHENKWLSDVYGYGIQLDHDWYSINLPSGTSALYVNLTFTHGDGNIDLALYDANGMFINGSNSITDDEYINITASLGGTYYLCVYNDHEGNNYDLKWSAIKPGVVVGGGGGGGGGGGDGDEEVIPGYNMLILIGSLLGSVVVASIIISKNCKRNYRK